MSKYIATVRVELSSDLSHALPMTTNDPAYESPVSGESAVIACLFPAAVRVVERRQPGDPEDLFPAEAAQVARAVPKRIQEFAAGRACARRALAELGADRVELLAGPDRQPLWRPDYVGTITHTDGYCAAAVAPTVSILAMGLDTETIGAASSDLWPAICDVAELDWIRALEPRYQAAAITLVFSAKEAFYKCQYPLTGEWLDFHDAHVRVYGWPEPRARFEVSGTRSIRFGDHVRLPVSGQCLRHEAFVSAAISVVQSEAPSRPCRRGTP
jgi:4'-phosphopantetheinyl transferase EntD